MKRNRSTLKDYFKKGAIPTEANFADLIDSMLNQDEDNISKLPNDPLRIVATGTEEGLINFYHVEQGNETLTWQIKQNPGGKPGLSIGDENASRLFIESGTGNIGIGITQPDAKLQVQGGQDRVSVHVGQGDGNDFTMDVAGGQGLVSLVAGAKIKPDGSGYTFMGTRGASKFTLHDGSIYFHTSDATSGTAEADAIGISGLNNAKMILNQNGNVGIGTTSPGAKLDINATDKTEGGWFEAIRFSQSAHSAITHPGGGLLFGLHGNRNFYFADIQGGFQKYVMQIEADTGNVGIGTTSPAAKLDVNGAIRAGNSDIYFTKTDHTHTGIGNALGFAAIENDSQTYNALMILGRMTTINIPMPPPFPPQTIKTRVVKVWDYLQVNGSMEVTGNLSVKGSKSGYIVDRFINSLDDPLEEGDVVVIRDKQISTYYGLHNNIPVPEVDLTQRAYDQLVCGIVSEVHLEMVSETLPGNAQVPERTKVSPGQFGTMVTLGAYSYCKVDADIAPIQVGDLLTTSPTKGHAQKVLEPSQAVGAVIGKALGALEKGKGKIPVLVMLL